MNKSGTSLVELIAVIVIMGVIAGIATLTVITVIDRQRKNATVNSLNNIYNTAKALLVEYDIQRYDENITSIDEDFCYISLTTLIDSGIIDGKDYKPVGDEIYYCYDTHNAYVLITSGDVTKSKPESTGSTTVNNILITFNYTTDKFIIA